MNRAFLHLRQTFHTAALFCFLVAMTARAATYHVSVEDSFFDPQQLAVQVGDTVIWEGFGSQDHTVTSDEPMFDEIVLYLQQFSFTFTAEGTVPYFCKNHGTLGGGGMAGEIIVSASTANTPPNMPVNLAPPNNATNQPLTPTLVASPFSDPDAQDFHAVSQWLVRRASDAVIVFNSGEDAVNKTNRLVPGGVLGYGSNYTWQVRHKDGRGEWSAYSTPTAFTTLVPVVAQGTGLKAGYANTTNFSAPLAVVTNATVNFDWGTTRPHRRITADAFAVRWEGSVLPEFTERYFFQFQYRGRARVWVNNQLLIDEWAGCAFSQTQRGAINLVGGQLATIRVDYLADAAGARAALRWTSPSVPMQLIPTARLFPPNP